MSKAGRRAQVKRAKVLRGFYIVVERESPGRPGRVYGGSRTTFALVLVRDRRRIPKVLRSKHKRHKPRRMNKMERLANAIRSAYRGRA